MPEEDVDDSLVSAADDFRPTVQIGKAPEERTRAWRRAQRKRVMANRRRFIRMYWHNTDLKRQWFEERSLGWFAKVKVINCSCWGCQLGTRRPEIIEPWDAPYVDYPAA